MTNTTAFKLGTFSPADGAPFVGAVLDERVMPLHELEGALAACGTMLELLADWQRSFEVLCRAVEAPQAQRNARPLSELRVHAPVPKPGTIYCSGANYKKHVVDLIVAHQDQSETHGMTLEQKRAWGMKLMDERAANGTPFIFIKPQSAVTGPFDPVVVPYDAKKPDWELELGVVIGRRARRVSRDRALDYVAGYTVVNDITLREKVFRRKTDSPELGMDFTVSKGAPTFLPMGPYLVPAAFVGDPQQLRVTLKLNGQAMQDEETADMIFTVARLIEYISSGVELRPGDVICTGSPAGNGMHYNRFIRDGDVLEGTITGLGTQRNPCVLEKV
jgi:2-keto-4-pentenoate hydratase/2-oxohepta-3-ene-1,7-dioic acid hydratase in catechol pathway